LGHRSPVQVAEVGVMQVATRRLDLAEAEVHPGAQLIGERLVLRVLVLLGQGHRSIVPRRSVVVPAPDARLLGLDQEQLVLEVLWAARRELRDLRFVAGYLCRSARLYAGRLGGREREERQAGVEGESRQVIHAADVPAPLLRLLRRGERGLVLAVEIV